MVGYCFDARGGERAPFVKGYVMTAGECQELANHYKALAREASISDDRAFILKNIARSFTGLATQLDRLAALKRDELRQSSLQDASKRIAPPRMSAAKDR